MPDRAKSGLLRMLPLGMAAAATWYLWRPFKTAGRQAATMPANEAVLNIDSEQNIVHANVAAASLFGSTPQAMRGIPLCHFILRDLR